jgi:hypothetical protein
MNLGILLQNRNWNIFTTSTITGEGITEGFNWLSKVINSKKH